MKPWSQSKQHKGLLIPLLVTGTYAAPKVRLDLAAMVGGQIPDADSLQQIIEDKADGSASEETELGDKAKRTTELLQKVFQ